MGYRFDYLVAPLRCGRCATVSPADETLGMTTRLRDNPQLAFLGVGDALPIDTSTVPSAGYLLLRQPKPREPTTLLQQWECPTCSYAYNWAAVTIRDGIIAAIEPVELNRSTLALANYIDDDVKEVAADLAGVRSYLDLDDDTAVALLKDLLPTSGGWRARPGHEAAADDPD